MTTAGWTGPADSEVTVPKSAPIARPIKSATRTSWAGLEPAIAPQRAHVPGESNDCQNNSLALFIILTVLSTAMNDEPTAIPGRSSLLLQPHDAICRNRAAAIRAQGGVPPRPVTPPRTQPRHRDRRQHQQRPRADRPALRPGARRLDHGGPKWSAIAPSNQSLTIRAAIHPIRSTFSPARSGAKRAIRGVSAWKPLHP